MCCLFAFCIHHLFVCVVVVRVLLFLKWCCFLVFTVFVLMQLIPIRVWIGVAASCVPNGAIVYLIILWQLFYMGVGQKGYLKNLLVKGKIDQILWFWRVFFLTHSHIVLLRLASKHIKHCLRGFILPRHLKRPYKGIVWTVTPRWNDFEWCLHMAHTSENYGGNHHALLWNSQALLWGAIQATLQKHQCHMCWGTGFWFEKHVL